MVLSYLSLSDKMRLRRSCKTLNHLVLSLFEVLNVPDHHLESLEDLSSLLHVLDGSRIQEISVLAWQGFSSDHLRLLSRKCEHVSRFRLYALCNTKIDVWGRALKDLKFFALQKLDLRGSTCEADLFTDENVVFPHLETLLIGIHDESEADALDFVFFGAWMKDRTNLSALFRSCPKLTRLECNRPCLVLDHVPEEANHLRSLAITHVDLTFCSLPNFPKLDDVSLRGSIIPLFFEGAINLTSVNVSCSSCSPLALSLLLDTAHRLRKLDLCYAKKLTSQPALVWELFQKHAHRLRGLSMIGLGGFTKMMTDKELMWLTEHIPDMRHIGVGSCTNLTFETLRVAFLEKWLNCEQISAQLLAIPEFQWRELFTAMPNLRKVDISGSSVAHSTEFLKFLEKKYPRKKIPSW